MEGLVYINGEMVERDAARISPFDRGFLYGYGLFETMRAYGGRVFAIDRHLARLMRFAEKLALASALDPDELEGAIYRTLEVNQFADARIRLTVSAGEGERGLAPPASGAPTVVIVVEQLLTPSEQGCERGVRAVIVDARRNSQSPLCGVKSLDYLESLLAHSQALAAGGDEAILLNERGQVAECSTSNIFIVAGGRLLTPSAECGILPGITRDIVMELASGLSIEVAQGEISPSALAAADEAFLTNSVVEIMPIASVDGRPVGGGGLGEVTARLMAAYRGLVQAAR